MQNNFHLNSAGYDLYEITKDEWIFYTKGGDIFTGTLHKVGVYAITVLGFKLEEIEYAIQAMIEKDHNAAHFGMHGGFIFSFKKEFSRERKAS